MRPWLLLVSLLVSDLSPLGDGDWVMDYFGCRELLLVGQTTHRGLQAVSLFCGDGKHVPAFLVESDALQSLHITTGSSPTNAGVAVIKDSRPAWSVHRHTAAPGRSFQAVLLHWALVADVQLQKTLTKRRRAAVIISCCPNGGEIKLAEGGEVARSRIKESTRRGVDTGALKHDGKRSSKASVSLRDIFQAAPLQPGSSLVKTSDLSQFEAQSRAAGVMKTHLNLEEASVLPESFQKELLPAKALSAAHDDRLHANVQLLLVPAENKASTHKPPYDIRPARDDNDEHLSWKIITKQTRLPRPEGGSETEQSHGTEDGEWRLAYVVQTHDTDHQDAGKTQKLSDAGEKALIELFLLDPNTVIKWETGDPPAITTVTQHSLETFVVKKMNLKASALRATETAAVKEEVKETEESECRNKSVESMIINPPKQSVIPSLQIRETETTEQEAETTTAASVYTATTEGFTRGEKSPEPDPDPDARPRFIKCRPGAAHAKAAEPPSGLRMREDVLANITDIHKDPRNEYGGATRDGTGTERKDLNDTGENASTKPAETNQREAADNQTSLMTQDSLETFVVKKMDLKASARRATETAAVKEEVKEMEESESTNKLVESMSINPPKQSVIPSLQIRETETTEQEAETTTAANVDTTATTEGFTRGEKSPEPDPDARPRFIKCRPGAAHAKAAEPPSGLRMREDVLANITDIHKGPRNEDGGATREGPGTERKDLNDTGEKASTKPAETNQREAADNQPETPLCRGLTHRTEAGWKHCMERLKQTPTPPEIFPGGRETTEAPEQKPEEAKESVGGRDDDPLNEDDHFYYFDGVLTKVQNNFYPVYGRQRRQRRQRSHDSRMSEVETKRGGGGDENLHNYIRHLTLRNKVK